MNLLKSKKNLLLLAASVIVWLGTCLLAMHWNTVYDGALGGFPAYLWVFAPVALAFAMYDTAFNSKSGSASRSGRDNTRWGQALSVYIITFLLYAALSSGIDPRYEVSAWWLVLLLVLAGIVTLCGKRVTRALKDSPLRLTAYNILLLYLPYAIAQLGMIAVLHPVTVEEIRAVGEAEGGEYMSRIEDRSEEHPLGLYFFINEDNGWYYYDALTGEPTSDFHSPYEPA